MHETLTRILEWFEASRIGYGEFTFSVARLLGLIAVVVLTWWGSRALEHAIQRTARRRSGLTGQFSGAYAIGRVLRYSVWVIGILWALSIVGVDVTNLALLGGAIGVGVGFGLQSIVSNFVSGLILMAERSLKIGDFVDLQSGVRGTVVEIAMRYTRVTTNDSVDVLVPNSEFVNGRVTNWTLDEFTRRLRIPFGVAYGSDKAQVKAAGLAAAKKVRGVIDNEYHTSDVWMTGFGDSSLNFELLLWIGPESIRSPSRVQAQALWALDDELRAADIKIPFPQRDLHIRSGLPACEPPAAARGTESGPDKD
ncbi:MAG: mechanosensitive ion channel domain-containing protein [Pseudomonadota bacterium]